MPQRYAVAFYIMRDITIFMDIEVILLDGVNQASLQAYATIYQGAFR
jgi:hypothetical protein